MTIGVYQKVRDLINHGITRECEVVYLLSCIRKFLEQDKVEQDKNDKWNRLKFYCDWALHAKLSGPSAQCVLDLFNEAHITCTNENNISEYLPQSVQDFSKFSGLVSEIKSFLGAKNIISNQQENYNWANFRFLYASIIEDCPLIINQNLLKGSNISKVTANVELAKEIKCGQQYYKVSWMIEDSSGNKGELYVINSFKI